MSSSQSPVRRNVQQTVHDLRKHLGIFTFELDAPLLQVREVLDDKPDLGLRPGSIVEWLVPVRGAGTFTSAVYLLAQSSLGKGVWAVIDDSRECYAPAFSGWGVDLETMLFLRPETISETCWTIEQCLRSEGVSVTLAWIDQRLPSRIHRRWQLAAEMGGGLGLFFRPEWAQREPTWADLRLLVTPEPGGSLHTRRMHIEMLYRRGGLGKNAQAWEIDHASGLVRLVS